VFILDFSAYSQFHTDLNIAANCDIQYKDSFGSLNKKYHIHDEYEIILCLSDNMFLDMERERFKVEKNTLLLLSNLDLHHFGPQSEDGRNVRYILNFKPSFVDFISTAPYNLLDCFKFRPFNNAPVLPLTEDDSALLCSKMDSIIKLQQSDAFNFAQELHIKLLVCEILLLINGMYYKYHNINSSLSSEKRQLVYTVMDYISSNYAQELSLDILAKKFYINKYSLCAMFKDVAAQSPGQFIINWRITKAKQKLLNGESVEKVCAETGFNSLSHFSTTFKARVGLSPKQFQRSAHPRPL